MEWIGVQLITEASDRIANPFWMRNQKERSHVNPVGRKHKLLANLDPTIVWNGGRVRSGECRYIFSRQHTWSCEQPAGRDPSQKTTARKVDHRSSILGTEFLRSCGSATVRSKSRKN